MLCEGVMSYAEASGDLTLGHVLLMNHPTQVGVSTGHRDAKDGRGSAAWPGSAITEDVMQLDCTGQCTSSRHGPMQFPAAVAAP